MKEKTWKWLGQREFVPGCPARDLLDSELDEKGIRQIVESSHLYKLVEPRKGKADKETK